MAQRHHAAAQKPAGDRLTAAAPMPKPMPGASAQTMQERIAVTHVRDLDIDADAMAVISNVFRVAALFRATAEKRFLNARQLSFSGFTVLWVLWVWGRMESHALAEQCGIAKGTLTGIVITLEKSGLVERKVHQTDRRRRLIQATRKGRNLARRAFLQVNRLEKEFVAGLNHREMTETGRLLRVILNTMQHD